MKYVVVLPYVYPAYFEDCVKTMAPEFKNHLLAIDNTVNNLGIMKSHNRGIDELYRQNADWLIIMSAAVRFGPTGGLDFINQLEDHPDHYVIHAASDNVVGGKQQDGGGGKNEVFGWHLTAFKREVFENIGRWDENFTPYGLDDIDLSIRLQKHYKGRPGWDTFPCDVHDTTMGHSINIAHVEAPYPPRDAYFQRKWGRTGGEWQKEAHDHPFNNEAYNLHFWPEPEHALSIQNNEYKKGWA